MPTGSGPPTASGGRPSSNALAQPDRRRLTRSGPPLEPTDRQVEAGGRSEAVPALPEDAVGADQERRRRVLDAEAAGERAVVREDGDRRIEVPVVGVVHEVVAARAAAARGLGRGPDDPPE